MEVHNPVARAAAILRQHGHESEAVNLEQFSENLVAAPAAEQQILRGIYAMSHAIDDEVIMLNWSGKGKNALNELVACIARELKTPFEPAEVCPERWQPIDTAYKDGTWMMLWRTPEEEDSPMQAEPLIFGRWLEECQSFVWIDGVHDLFTPWGQAAATKVVEDGNGCALWECSDFTHWQPLPAPPSATPAKEPGHG